MLDSFNEYWGTGDGGTLLTENNTLGKRKRQKGLPLLTLLAATLDPRTKDLDEIDEIEQVELWSALSVELVKLAPKNMNTTINIENNEGKLNMLL